jgi:hypothetical protein
MLVWITRMLAHLPLSWLQAVGASVGRCTPKAVSESAAGNGH